MDTFENFDNNTPEESSENTPVQEGSEKPSVQENASAEPEQSQPEEAPDSHLYRGAGAGQKESPYADSPYVTGAAPRQDPIHYGYQYQPQQTKPPKKEKAHRAHRSVWGRVLAAVLVVAVVAAGCLITAASVNSAWEKRSSADMAQMNAKISALEKQISDASKSNGDSISGSPVATSDGLTPGQVYAQNVDSVVTISCTIQSRVYGQVAQGTSSGSGFIITSDGYVVTNHHVVENATAIKVIAHDGTEYSATVKGSDANNDVAVLKVDAEDLPPVTLGSSNDLVIGDMVVAIGNPLGTLSATQTVGYVSGTNREVTTDNTIINMIQTDAVINPGNSGGPLFNMRGEVVGITTAKYSGTTTSGASIEGIGFAIPIDDVLGIIGDLQNLGYVTGAYLGITVQDVDSEAASRYGLPSGAYVASVVDGGAADRAGVQPKDIITGIGDIQVTSMTSLTRALRSFKAGDTTTITVVRSGQTLTLTITLDERPQDLDSSSSQTDPSMPSEGDYDEWYDFFRRYFGN